MFKFRSASFIQYTSNNVPINLGKYLYHIMLLKDDDVTWGLEYGYSYVPWPYPILYQPIGFP